MYYMASRAYGLCMCANIRFIACMHACSTLHTRIHSHRCACGHSHPYTYMQIHTCAHACVRTYTPTHIQRYVHTDVRMQHIETQILRKYMARTDSHINVHTHTHTHIHTYTHTHIHTHMHTHTYKYIASTRRRRGP